MIVIKTDKMLQEIKKRKAKKVLIQAPEGIKGIVSRFIPELIEETGANILIHGEACYGGCDLGLVDAERMNIDLVLHVGHTPYFTNKDDPKLVFIEAKDNQEFQNSTLQEILKISKGKTMGLLSSAQYLHHLPKIQDFLNKNNIKSIIGRSTSRFYLPGQVLGCEVSTAKSIRKEIDAYLILGGGDFHALGIALWTGKESWLADPYKEAILDLNPMVRKKLAIIASKIEKAKQAKNFGVILGLKEGQMREREETNITKKLKKTGKKTIELALREVTPERLMYYKWIDCFIQTLCPRVSVEDLENYDVPMLNYEQFQILVGEKEFHDIYPDIKMR